MKWLSALLLCIVSISMPSLTLAASSPVDSVTGDTPYIIQPEAGEPCNPDHDKPTCSVNRKYVVFCHTHLAKWVPTMECRETLCDGRILGPGDGEPIISCFPRNESPRKLPDYILHELNTESSSPDSSNQKVQEARRIPNPECEPGKMKCDASFYAAMICDEQGTWKVSRKCLKPGCCELAQITFGAEVVARCRKECGPGQTPPGNIPSSTKSVVVVESTSSSAVETSVEDTPYEVLPTTSPDSESSSNNQPRRIPNPECEPGDQKCDASHYAAYTCDEEGTWKVSRKCLKPGCCELIEFQIDMKPFAQCKKECGPGQTPPGNKETSTKAWSWSRTFTWSNVGQSTSSDAPATETSGEDTPYGVLPTTLARVVLAA